jgi:hypothetical protein
MLGPFRIENAYLEPIRTSPRNEGSRHPQHSTGRFTLNFELRYMYLFLDPVYMTTYYDRFFARSRRNKRLRLSPFGTVQLL